MTYCHNQRRGWRRGARTPRRTICTKVANVSLVPILNFGQDEQDLQDASDSFTCGLIRSRWLGPRGPVASLHGAPALAKCFPSFRSSLSRHANLSPLIKRLESQDLQCDFCRIRKICENCD